MADPLAVLRDFLEELKRRHVIRVGVAYLVVAWVLIEVGSVVFPALQLPDWTTTLVVVMALFGFPLALILAWAFDMTPEGIRRTPPPRPSIVAPEEDDLGGLLRRLSGQVGTGSQDDAGPSAGPAVARSEAPEEERVHRASLAKLRHDLRSPINAVVGYAEMLLEEGVGDDDSETAGDLRKIREGGKELQAVVDEVLDPDGLDRQRERWVDDEDGFAQDLQHRLRTPLNAVIGYGEMVLERQRAAGREPVAEDVEKILTAGRKLLDRSDEIIRFCTAEARGEATSSDYERVSTIAREALGRIRAVEPGQGEDVAPAGGALLVVDDSELNRNLLTRRLALQGFTVSTAATGEEGLRQMKSRPFDIVLLDILMPGTDGVEVLTRMKADPELRDVPVIMISALDEVDTAVRCIEAGAADYVSKPFDPVLLTARVVAALRTRRLHEEASRSRNQLRVQEELVKRLLYTRFPETVARRVRRGETEFADLTEEASVLCAHFSGLQARLALGDPVDGLRRLHAVRSWVRELAAEREVDTVLFSGSECLLVSGVPAPRADHLDAAMEVALEMLEDTVGVEEHADVHPDLRMGLHCGSVLAGVVGEEALSYEVWGDTVQIARELASAGVPGALHVSAALRSRLGEAHAFESRGVVELGERGRVRTSLLRAQAAGAG